MYIYIYMYIYTYTHTLHHIFFIQVSIFIQYRQYVNTHIATISNCSRYCTNMRDPYCSRFDWGISHWRRKSVWTFENKIRFLVSEFQPISKEYRSIVTVWTIFASFWQKHRTDIPWHLTDPDSNNRQFIAVLGRSKIQVQYLEIEVLWQRQQSMEMGRCLGRSQLKVFLFFLCDFSYWIYILHHLTFLHSHMPSYAHESRTNSVVSFESSLLSQPSQPQQPRLCQGIWRVLPVAQWLQDACTKNIKEFSTWAIEFAIYIALYGTV